MKDQPREVPFEVVGKDEPLRRGNDPASDPFIATVTRLMDAVFTIPGTNVRFGLDPIIGLLPGLGAPLSAVISLVLIGKSARFGVPKVVLGRMALNVAINSLLDAVPVIGGPVSVFYRSNVRNYELLRKHAHTRRPATTGDRLFVFGLIGGLLLLMALVITGAVTILGKVFTALTSG